MVIVNVRQSKKKPVENQHVISTDHLHSAGISSPNRVTESRDIGVSGKGSSHKFARSHQKRLVLVLFSTTTHPPKTWCMAWENVIVV